jgi:tRNA-intron endonuclease
MPIQLSFKGGEIFVTAQADIDSLRRTHFGVVKNKSLFLYPEEALYLMDVRNAQCFDEEGKAISFNDLSEKFIAPKFLARYLTYKDWRERGLIIRRIEEARGPYQRNPVKKYPSKAFTPPQCELEGLFFPDDRIAVIDDSITGRELYEKYWIGQYGSYKAEERGRLLKLDPFETRFMVEHSGLKMRNYDNESLKELLSAESDFKSMYEVYEDWRLRGFVLKTGFKFGTHFRIYFPGAAPAKKGEAKEWAHSKHVIHVFPRSKRMIIAEWARAIRVAHSVRKTFILAIPGRKTKPTGTRPDFLLYHRKQGGIETPDKDEPSYVMLSLAEDEMIGGAELADAIEAAKGLGLDLMLAIADRETSVTYYRVKRIELPGSKYQYYEIEWAQP